MSGLSGHLMTVFWPLLFGVTLGCVVWAWALVPAVPDRGRVAWRRGGVTALVLVPLAALVVAGAGFAYHDDDNIVQFSAVGRGWPVSIWPNEGRFFPLYMQEFDVIAKLSTTPTAYYLAMAVQLVVAGLLLGLALEDLSWGYRVTSAVALFTAGGTAITFVEAVYPERNAIFLLLGLLAALRAVDNGRSSRTVVAAALVCAHLMAYYKEPLFLIPVTFAVARLLAADGWRRTLRLDTIRRRPLEVGLLVVSAVFVVQLGLLLLGATSNRYVEDATIGPLAALGRYLRTDALVWVLIGAVALRVVRRRAAPRWDPTWDSAALAALVYLLALVGLGLAADRYMGPVHVLVVTFAVRELAALRPGEALRRVAVGVGAVLGVVSLLFGAVRVAERASVVRSTEAMATFLADYTASRPGATEVFFGDAEKYRIMNFLAHLDYAHPGTVERLRVTGDIDFPDGKCISFRDFRCERVAAPGPGALVVHLADDDSRDTGPGREPVFTYRLLPTDVPTPLGRLVYPAEPLAHGSSRPPARWLTGWIERVPG